MKNYWLDNKSLGCEEAFTYQTLSVCSAFFFSSLLPPSKSIFWVCCLQSLQGNVCKWLVGNVRQQQKSVHYRLTPHWRSITEQSKSTASSSKRKVKTFSVQCTCTHAHTVCVYMLMFSHEQFICLCVCVWWFRVGCVDSCSNSHATWEELADPGEASFQNARWIMHGLRAFGPSNTTSLWDTPPKINNT